MDSYSSLRAASEKLLPLIPRPVEVHAVDGNHRVVESARCSSAGDVLRLWSDRRHCRLWWSPIHQADEWSPEVTYGVPFRIVTRDARSLRCAALYIQSGIERIESVREKLLPTYFPVGTREAFVLYFDPALASVPFPASEIISTRVKSIVDSTWNYLGVESARIEWVYSIPWPMRPDGITFNLCDLGRALEVAA